MIVTGCSSVGRVRVSGTRGRQFESAHPDQKKAGNFEDSKAPACIPNLNLVYKNYDPRAAIVKKHCHELFNKLDAHDPLLDIAFKLENVALKDEYFIERKLYPNVDFYSGLIYKAVGIPTNMFTVMFAIGRMPGWIAHWKEMNENPPKID